MKAAVFRGKENLSIEDIPAPSAGPGKVVVKVKYCGICGTDLRLFAEEQFPPGSIMGHEFCGTVWERGEGVVRAVGEKVVVRPYSPCGKCYSCVHGEPQLCLNTVMLGTGRGRQGAFAPMVETDPEMLFPLPREIGDDVATLTEPLAVALHAVRKSGVGLGDTVVIFGAGPIGLFVLQGVRLAGAGAIYVVEAQRERARVASSLGAARVFDPGVGDIRREIRDLTRIGVDRAYVCTAAPGALHQAARSVRPGGKVMMVGGGSRAEVVPEYWMLREIEVKGVYAYGEEFPIALSLLQQGKVTTAGLISAIIPLERIQQAFRELRQGSPHIKVIIRMEGEQ